MRTWVLFSLALRKVSSSYKTYCESYCKNKEAWIGVDKPHFKSSIVKSQGVSTSSLAKNLNPVFKFFEKNNIPLSQIIFKVSDEIIQKEFECKYFVNSS